MSEDDTEVGEPEVGDLENSQTQALTFAFLIEPLSKLLGGLPENVGQTSLLQVILLNLTPIPHYIGLPSAASLLMEDLSTKAFRVASTILQSFKAKLPKDFKLQILNLTT